MKYILIFSLILNSCLHASYSSDTEYSSDEEKRFEDNTFNPKHMVDSIEEVYRNQPSKKGKGSITDNPLLTPPNSKKTTINTPPKQVPNNREVVTGRTPAMRRLQFPK